ncbi:MAG: hypothetical protein HYU57_02745 [Micavibrio aeruginosavorus]|nr:hypothetical protein [Micavibrio aeruginosavorus]
MPDSLKAAFSYDDIPVTPEEDEAFNELERRIGSTTLFCDRPSHPAVPPPATRRPRGINRARQRGLCFKIP